MKKLLLSITMMLGLALIGNAQELPKPSPSATIMQRVGLTDITVEYSRPGVNDRIVWGELVPYGEIWRAGANKATMMTISSEIKIEDKVLPAGSYSIFIQPEEKGAWTVIFNTETELWGTGEYNKDNDAARVKVTPTDVACVSERLEYRFTQVDMRNATFNMTWAGKSLNMKVVTNPDLLVKQNIESALAEAEDDAKWKVYRNAASYAEDVNMTSEGIYWIEESIKLSESWYSYWVYGGLLAQKKDFAGAMEKGKKAIELGEASAKEAGNEFGYKARIQADIDKWESMK